MWTFQYKHGDRPLEGYTILRAAGRGGFGEVYHAVSDGGREVALKAVLGYEQIELRGIGQCMNLKSPHLVTIFDVRHNDAGRPFVLMEYISGPSLRHLLDESPAGLGTQKAAFFLREMAKGLTYLHDCGIVHRDLKPGNIFYENGYVKIGDYGLSKAITNSMHSGQTVTVGTVHYMAPEIGAGKYDRGIDIYALGTVLYEMLTGTVPYLGASPTEVLLKHLSAEPDVSGIPEPFATVIKKAMAKDPAQRYQSVQEMVEAVFGADHIRESVSVFRPEELSVVAERVAAKLTAGTPGAGVAAAAGSGGIGAATARAGGGVGVIEADAGSSVTAAGPAHRPDFWQRMGDAVDRVVCSDEWYPGAAHAPADRAGSGGAAGGAGAQAGGRPSVPSVVPDPMPERQRIVLGAVVALVIAVVGGVMGNDHRVWDGPVGPMLFVFTSILGGVAALLVVSQLMRSAVRVPAVPRRLATGVVLAFGAGITSLPSWPFVRDEGGRLLATWIAVALPLLVMDVFAWVWPDRPARVWLRKVIRAGLFGFVLALVFQGYPPMALAILAGMCMTAQVLSPWNPAAASLTRPRSPRWPHSPHSPPQPREAAGFIARQGFSPHAAPAGPAVPPQGRPAGPPPVPPPAQGPYAPNGVMPPQAGAAEVPAVAAVFWLGGLLGFLTLGIMSLVAAGNTHNPNDFGPFLAMGLSSLVAFLFCVRRMFQRTFPGWWRYLFRPVLALACLSSILSSIIVMGNAHHLNDGDVMTGTFFIVFPAAVLLLLMVLPRTVLGDARRWVKVPAPAERSPHAPETLLGMWLLGLVGACGIHRLVAGRVAAGILWLCTGGLLGIGQLVDLILILTGNFTDAEGRRVSPPFAMARLATESAAAPAGPAVPPPPTPVYNGGTDPVGGQAGAAAAAANQAPEPAAAGYASYGSYPSAGPGGQPQSFTTTYNSYRQKAADAASALVAMVGLLLVFLALAASLATSLYPLLALAGVVDPGFGEMVKERLAQNPNWLWMVYQIGALVSVVLWLSGVTALLLGRRRRGIGHMARGGIAALILGLGLMPMHTTLQSMRVWNRTQARAAADVLPRLLDLGVTLPMALIFFAAIVLLVWPARRPQSAYALPATAA